MKVKVTESQLATYFNEVIKEMDMCSCEESVLNEALTPTDKSDVKTMVKKEIKDFLDINRSSDLEKKVTDIIKKKFKTDKDIEKYVVDITRNVLVQLYKNLWTKRSFWSNDLKNSAS
jgi:hypothetical protein